MMAAQGPKIRFSPSPTVSEHSLWVLPYAPGMRFKDISLPLSPTLQEAITNNCKQANQICWRPVQTSDGVPQTALFIHIGTKANRDQIGPAALIKNIGAASYQYTHKQDFSEMVFHWDVYKRVWKSTMGTDLGAQDLAHLLMGALLMGYTFVKPLKKDKPSEKALMTIVSSRDSLDAKTLEELATIANAIAMERTLTDTPANFCTPTAFAKQVTDLFAGVPNVHTKIHSKEDMKKMGMDLLLAVNAGSDEPPKLVEITYQPKGKNLSKVALVGKGVTFDSGGYCLKSPQNMDKMKYDMCGGATMLAVAYCVAQLRLPIQVKTVIPLTENLINGKAVKMGDVIRSMQGTTVEINNTDAEGRLILADALTYASQWKPNYMIDAATLTGAVTVALGTAATGVMGFHADFLDMMKKSAWAVGERVWELPMFEEYRTLLKSKCADISNVTESREAGSSIAGIFLSYFVPRDIPWIHMDIAGTASDNKSRRFYPKNGASGSMIMTLVEMMRRISK